MWAWFTGLIFTWISFTEGLVGDWGLAIIVITIIVRIVLLPLTLRQMRSSTDMQLLQPKMKELQERYADDPTRLNEEMRKFYSENNFNPLAGCLPVLVQMPIFFALFRVLRNQMPEGSAFYNILPDLTTSASTVFSGSGLVSALPYVIFVVLFALFTFLPMFLMNNGDRNTLMMGAVMGVMMLFVGWTSPAGVTLYWVVSAGWGTVQQIIIKRDRERDALEEEEKKHPVKPIEVDVTRTDRKKRPHKSK